jgi:hypothetical protein
MEGKSQSYDPDAPLRNESKLALEALQSIVEFGTLPEACVDRWEYKRLLEITLAHGKIGFPKGELREEADPEWLARIGDLQRMILRDAMASESLPELFPDQPQEPGIPFSIYQTGIVRSLQEETRLMSRACERAYLMLEFLDLRPGTSWLQEAIDIVARENMRVELF